MLFEPIQLPSWLLQRKIFFFEYTERTVECELFDRVCVNYFRFTGGLCFFFFFIYKVYENIDSSVLKYRLRADMAPIEFCQDVWLLLLLSILIASVIA